MPRITKGQYKQALRARYRDLKDELRGQIIAGGLDYDSEALKEMKLISNIARLHRLDIKEPE